jgi:hypothetical protein
MYQTGTRDSPIVARSGGPQFFSQFRSTIQALSEAA